MVDNCVICYILYVMGYTIHGRPIKATNKGAGIMKHEKVVELEKAARKSGGDRYADEFGFQVYIPQEISRAKTEGRTPAKVFKLTFEEVA